MERQYPPKDTNKMASSLNLYTYYDKVDEEYKWLTHSAVNTHIFFCKDCGVEDHSSEGCCTECLNKEQLRDLAERFYLGECYAEHDDGYAAAKAWYLGELGEPPTLEQANYLGKKLLTWYDSVEEEEVLSLKRCADCGVSRQETEPELLCDWFCPPCWTVRFKTEHVCSGAFEYRPEERVCDKSGDPRCPQHIGEWLF